MICVECNKHRVKVKRAQICRGCAKNPEVRDLYGLDDYWKRVYGKLPDDFTNALPGTSEKIEVMARRAGAGCTLHHPLDAQSDSYGDALATGQLLPAFILVENYGEKPKHNRAV